MTIDESMDVSVLGAHLRPPRQPGHHRCGRPGGIDGEHPPGILGLLPRVEGVDQIETGPRHRGVRGGLAVGERGFDQAQALVEREPGRPGGGVRCSV